MKPLRDEAMRRRPLLVVVAAACGAAIGIAAIIAAAIWSAVMSHPCSTTTSGAAEPAFMLGGT